MKSFLEFMIEKERSPEKAMKLLDRISKMKKFKKPDLGKFYINPPEEKTSQITSLSKIESRPTNHVKYGDAIGEKVPLDKIFTSQETISAHVVKNKIKNNDDSSPTLYHHPNGKYYVDDGNHGIARSRLLGKKEITARVYKPRENK